MTKWERRCRRESQQKYRKLGPSPATILENTQVVLCVEHGRLTEGEGASILRVSIHDFRMIRLTSLLLASDVSKGLADDLLCQQN